MLILEVAAGVFLGILAAAIVMSKVIWLIANASGQLDQLNR